MEDVKTCLASWLREADTWGDEKVELRGDKIAKRFRLVFKGDMHTATRRAAKARTLLRTRDGWRAFPSFRSATGKVLNKVYIDVDKNACQVRKEREVKVLLRVTLALLPEDVKDRTLRAAASVCSMEPPRFAAWSRHQTWTHHAVRLLS